MRSSKACTPSLGEVTRQLEVQTKKKSIPTLHREKFWDGSLRGQPARAK